MKRLKPWIITAFAAALALTVVTGVFAQSPPGPGSFPSPFLGTVTDPDGEVPEGLAVSTYVGDREEACNASAVTSRAAGGSVTQYFVLVEHTSLLEGCGTNGDEVRFKIGDRWATQTGTFAGGGPQTLNLTLAPAAPETVTIRVAVWRLQSDPSRLFVSTRAPGSDWVTHPDQLIMSEFIGRQRWDRSDFRAVEVTLSDDSTVTIRVAVWRLQSDPSRLFVSTRAPENDWVTHPDQLIMSEFIGRQRWDRSDFRAVEVALQ